MPKTLHAMTYLISCLSEFLLPFHSLLPQCCQFALSVSSCCSSMNMHMHGAEVTSKAAGTLDSAIEIAACHMHSFS